MPGQIYVFSGPSGAGKSTLIRAVKQGIAGLEYSISHTSRRPRGNEQDGADYHFVEREVFRRMIDQGEFAEWAEVYDDCYGTSFESLKRAIDKGLDVIMDIDVQGARNIKRIFKESVLIFVLPPSLQVLEERLKARGTDDEAALEKRVERASKEIGNCAWYDYLIFNDSLEEAVQEAGSIIIAERCRRAQRLAKAQTLFCLAL
jgi:guanylate kinase